jgi:hypothetical protein
MLQIPQAQAERSDPADLARKWLSLSWLAVVVGGIYILAAKLKPCPAHPRRCRRVLASRRRCRGRAHRLRTAWPMGSCRWHDGGNHRGQSFGDRNLASSLVFALCNAGEAPLAAALIDRYFGSPFSLGRLRHVLGLVGAAIVATAVSGIGGALGFAFFYGAKASFLSTWQNWFASDALGIVTIAPLVIGLASVGREPPTRSETIEGLIALASLIIVSHRHCTAARAVDNGCADRAAVSDPVVDRGTLSTSLRCGGGLYRHPRNCLDHDNRNRLLR